MSRDIFVGRYKELDILTRELLRDPNEEDAFKLFYIEGEEKVGKTALVSQLWEKLVESGGSFIWSSIPEMSGEEPEHQRLEKLVQSMDSNKQNLIKKIGSFARAFGTASFEFQNQEVAMPSQGVLEVWLELFKNHFYSDTEINKSDPTKAPRIVLVLDDFTRYPNSMRSWFKETFIFGLAETNLLSHFQFVFTSARPISMDSDMEQYLDGFDFARHDTFLKTFNVDEIHDFLRKRGTPEISSSKILEKTGGYPAEVVLEIEKQEKQPVSDSVRKEITNLLTGKTTRQKYWLKAAAHLSVCNEESLALFCPHEEVSKALEWLKGSSGVDFQNLGYGLLMDLDMSKRILRWLKSFEKEEFGRLLNIAEKYNEFVDAIPQPQARVMLTDLSVFNYFNGDLIRRVLKADEKPYLELTRRIPEFFDSGQFNHRINKEHRNYISNYRDLLIEDHYKVFEIQVKKEWDLIKTEALDKKESLEKEMIIGQRDMKIAREEIEELKIQVESHREKVVEALDRERKIDFLKSRIDKSSKTKFPGMLYQILGVAIVLITAIYPGAYSLLNVLFGIAIIVYGAFGPLKKQKKVQDNTDFDKTLEMKQEEDLKVEGDPNIRMLSFKKNNSEIRFKQLHNMVSRLKGQLKDLDKRLDEPYPYIGS